MKATELLSTLPSGWQTVPIKAACYYTVSNVDKHSIEDEIPVRLCNYTDVYKNDRISPELELMAATATEDEIEKFHLEVGDVVITKDSESWDDIGIPAYVEATAEDFVCGYHLGRCQYSCHLKVLRYMLTTACARASWLFSGFRRSHALSSCKMMRRKRPSCGAAKPRRFATSTVF